MKPTLWAVMSMTCLLFGLVEIGVGFRRRRDAATIVWGGGNLMGAQADSV